MLSFWFNISRKIRFVIAGCFNAFVSYGIYAAYCFFMGDQTYQTALVLSWVLSSVISFNVQKYLVFQSKGNWFKEYLKCGISWGLSYLINALLLEIFVKFINVFAAQILATICVALVTYILFKHFAFKKFCS